MDNIQLKLNNLLVEAITMHVSDIHLNIDRDINEIIARSHKRLVYRFSDTDAEIIYGYCRHLAHFDVATSKPQSGVFRWYIEETTYYIRFSAIESYQHKSGVLRILNLHHIHSIEASIPLLKDREAVLNLFMHNVGIVLFVGKTGSGKSTTMFNCLSHFEDHQIYTLENPIERFNAKWIQIEMSDYSEGLTQLLRHEPDVVVLGEVRHEGDIKELIRAGLSGHFVVSTMHAGSARQTIRRLLDLGASAYDIREILVGVVYQVMHVKGDVIDVEYDVYDQKRLETLFVEIETA